MNRRKKNQKKKLIFGSLLAVFLLLGSMVFYYKFDPELLTRISFYLDLANPSVSIVRVEEGLRKEQVAEVVGDKLGWDEKEKEAFVNAHIALRVDDLEGKYFPKTYMMPKDGNPLDVSEIMLEEFSKNVDKIKKPKTSQIINEDTAVKIASIIQREAGGKKDMALISGIIWNRIWKGMKLEIDATLQYAKGTEEEGWWPRVVPEDKKIDSEYNTYKHEGLPPSPIASPGKDAIYAAYNPERTDCIFYIHDKKRRIHCAETYEEHKQNIEKYY